MASIVLMQDTNGLWENIGTPVRVDSYYPTNEGRYTVAIYTQNLRGNIYIESSLATNPTECDWFPIWLTPTCPYASYPLNPASPTDPSGDGDTGTDAYAFEINTIWIRARLDRSGWAQPGDPQDYALFGSIRKILLSR